MKTEKNSRKTIEKGIVKELKLRLNSSGWILAKPDVNYFLRKYTEEVGWGFTFSLYNNGPYSCFYKVYVVYTKYTTLIKEILKGKPECDFMQEVGLVSSSIPQNIPILTISTLEEIPDFVDEMVKMINKSEQEYWLHYSDVENTVSEFKQSNHVFWPVSNLSQYIVHMVSYSIENNRADILKTAIVKAKELLNTGNYERDRNFVNTIINAIELV